MSLIYNGKDVSGGLTVHDWTEHGMRFTRENRGATRRRGTNIDLIGYHWSGGEGGEKRIYRTLRRRKTRSGVSLGIHLFVRADGEIFQFADLADRVYHAGKINNRSVGIEFQNRGKPPARKVPRGVYWDTVHGRLRSMLMFTAQQVDACVSLTDVLCGALDIPRLIPIEETPCPCGAHTCVLPLAKLLKARELRAFSGVLGHYHVSRRRIGPGTQLFRALLDEDYRPA